MAISFTSDEKATLCFAFGWFITELDEQISYVSEHIDSDTNTRLQSEIAKLKEDFDKEHIEIVPVSENFGASIKFSAKANKLTKRIASILAIPATSLNMASSNRLVRG